MSEQTETKEYIGSNKILYWLNNGYAPRTVATKNNKRFFEKWDGKGFVLFTLEGIPDTSFEI